MPGQASMEDLDVARASESEGGLGVLQGVVPFSVAMRMPRKLQHRRGRSLLGTDGGFLASQLAWGLSEEV